MGTIVGIDLGTSTSEIAVFEHGRPLIVNNSVGKPVTPSAIWVDPSSGEMLVGETAYGQAGAVLEFKRKMGSEEKLRIGSRNFSPEECSALLLKYLVESFHQSRRDQEADRAVITVPANWKDGPRRATLEAGRLAGLKVERLINEPTAAAMAFGARPEAEGKTIAVYDLGGGTFDVTILRIHDKIFDVVTSVGDDRLGGSDFDALLMRHVIEQIAVAHGYTHVLGRDLKADHALKMACEGTKKALSLQTEAAVQLPYWPAGNGRTIDVAVRVQRKILETLIEPLVQRSLEYLDEALRRAKLTREAVDDVVMVGGSTRIPLVRRRVAERMGKEPNTQAVNPDEAVALGAAIQAGIFDQEEVDDDSFLVLDNVNTDLGVETMVFINEQPVTGVFSAIIPKDTKVPATMTESYSTVVDNQKQIEVKCFQGNSRWVAQNRLIGDPIQVPGLPSGPAGSVKVDITFSLSASEVLDVGIQVHNAGIMVTRSFSVGGSRYSDSQHAQRRANVESLWQSSELAGKYKVLVEKVEAKLNGPLPAATASSLRTQLAELKRAIAAADTQAAEQLDLAISNILFDLD